MPTRLHPRVCIVIPTWNGVSDTLVCLSSLASQNFKDFSVVVVDNGSSDSTVQEVQSNFPDVELIRNPSNFGFAEASNIGIKFAQQCGAEFVFLLNNDTLVCPKALEAVVHYAEKHPDGCIFGARLEIETHAAQIPFTRKNLHMFWGNRKNRQHHKESGPIDLVWGTGMLIRTRLFEEIGYFDSSFFSYAEDRDFCLRAGKAGAGIYYVADSVIFHKVSASTGGLQKDSCLRAYLIGRNHVKLWRKHYSRSQLPTFIRRLLVTFVVTFISRWLRRNPRAASAGLVGMWEGLHTDDVAWPKFPARYCDIDGIDLAVLNRYRLKTD